jgi:exonuclease III
MIFYTKIDHTKVVIICVYAPNDERAQIQYFHNLKQLIHKQKLSEDHLLIMGGDFNLTLSPELDKRGDLETKEQARAVLESLMEELNLIDIWRIKHPGLKRFTWRQYNPS